MGRAALRPGGEPVKDYVKNGHQYPRPPVDRELKKQCAGAGVTSRSQSATTPTVQFAQAGREHGPDPPSLRRCSRIRSDPRAAEDGYLRAAAVLQAHLSEREPGHSQNEKLKVHAERIGDYSMSALPCRRRHTSPRVMLDAAAGMPAPTTPSRRRSQCSGDADRMRVQQPAADDLVVGGIAAEPVRPDQVRGSARRSLAASSCRPR